MGIDDELVMVSLMFSPHDVVNFEVGTFGLVSGDGSVEAAQVHSALLSPRPSLYHPVQE